MRVGIIGCGYVFDKYMPTWGNHPDLIIAGVSDIDPKRVDAVTRYYGLKGYPDNASLLADPEIDIVANFTPIRVHYEVSKAALEAGKHVYSEKPLVTRMDQARELVALAPPPTSSARRPRPCGRRCWTVPLAASAWSTPSSTPTLATCWAKIRRASPCQAAPSPT